MARKLTPGRLVIASHNAGKIIEINELVGPFGLEVVSAGDLGLPSPAETEETFQGNAAIKAHAAAQGAQLPALADDSGLEIFCLDNQPGVHAADWAEKTPGDERDFAYAMARVEKEMGLAADRSKGDNKDGARFVCCLCVAWPDGHEESFLGEVRGRISFPPRGAHGFGYDPIFIADGEAETFGEMAPARKHAMSHRADAFAKLVAGCLR